MPEEDFHSWLAEVRRHILNMDGDVLWFGVLDWLRAKEA